MATEHPLIPSFPYMDATQQFQTPSPKLPLSPRGWKDCLLTKVLTVHQRTPFGFAAERIININMRQRHDSTNIFIINKSYSKL
jgi:hypothetical protein